MTIQSFDQKGVWQCFVCSKDKKVEAHNSCDFGITSHTLLRLTSLLDDMRSDLRLFSRQKHPDLQSDLAEASTLSIHVSDAAVSRTDDAL